MVEPLIPSRAVEGLMTKAFLEGTMAAGLFWDALLKCALYVPVQVDAPGAEEDEIPMLLGVGTNGELVVWLFTSPEAMASYTERELTFKSVPARSLFASVADSEHEVVLIGPDGLTLSLHPDLIATLADGKVPETPEEEVRYIPKKADVAVGEPSAESLPLEACFREAFAGMPEILEAAFIQVADDAGSRLLLGLRLVDQTEDGLRDVAGVVAKAAEGVLDKGKTMDITLIDRSLKGAFEKWGKFFYRRA